MPMKTPALPPDAPLRLPVLAIAGRPNVGKSAIFNRLAGRRISIVHEESGVTRDRLACEAEWQGVPFEVVDTGGIVHVPGARARNEIEAGVRRQVETALQEAAAVLFVTDVETGLMPLDENVADWLRRSGARVFLTANKCDHPGRDTQAAEFDRLGFPVFPVSAIHNRGFDTLMQEVVQCMPRRSRNPVVPAIRIAVVGRRNVGKSSYVNRLLRADRVIVSEVPGTTVDSIDIPFSVGAGAPARHYVLTDTAGLRPVGRMRSAVERFSLMRTEKSIRNADVVVLMLDASQGPTAQDKKIAALILSHRRGCVILVNKWDIAQQGNVTQRAYEPALRREIPFLDYVPVVYGSAQSGYNIRKTIETVDHVAAQVSARLPTAPLNRTIQEAQRQLPPPRVQGRRLKIFYAVQLDMRPLRIALYVNHPEYLKPAYEAYLVRKLREEFGLEGAPVILELKARRGED